MPTTEEEDIVSQTLDATRQRLAEIRNTTDKQAEEFSALCQQIEGDGFVDGGEDSIAKVKSGVELPVVRCPRVITEDSEPDFNESLVVLESSINNIK